MINDNVYRVKLDFEKSIDLLMLITLIESITV